MGSVVVVNHLSLDGVMQAPGAPDEDRRGGFEHGGWAIPGNDAVMGEVMAEGMGASGALLLGRRTYDDLEAAWASAPDDSPYAAPINEARKYVASTRLREPLSWRNSTLLDADVPAAVAELKQRLDGNLTILGSGELVQALMRHNLIDRFVLPIHPLVLGSGRRLFSDGGSYAQLRLINTRTTTTGVVIAFYAVADQS
jgi:dihydrofolate reductase